LEFFSFYWSGTTKNAIKYSWFSHFLKNVFLLSQKSEKYRYFVDLPSIWNFQKYNKIYLISTVLEHYFLLLTKSEKYRYFLDLPWPETSKNTIKYTWFSQFFKKKFISQRTETCWYFIDLPLLEKTDKNGGKSVKLNVFIIGKIITFWKIIAKKHILKNPIAFRLTSETASTGFFNNTSLHFSTFF